MIVVNLDVMMAKRKISLTELADRIGLTERELTAIGHDNPLRLINL